MTTSVTSNGANRTADPAGLNALLQIGPEAKSRIRILVVDDEHTLRESCASVLGGEGYDVTVSGRGQEALELIKRRPFDIVLADLYMSQVDGLALLRAALAANADTIVIVMTGNPSVESSIEALRQGAWDYLPKPFTAQHLQIAIGRAVHTVVVGQETREQEAELDRQPAAGDKVTLLGTSAAFRSAIELAVRRGELRRPPRGVARIRDVRAPQGGVHGRGPRQSGPARSRERRHPVPGRADRDVQADPGEA